MANTDDAITPARLRADGWKWIDSTDRSHGHKFQLKPGYSQHVYLKPDGRFSVGYLFIRTVTGMADLRRILAALKGDVE